MNVSWHMAKAFLELPWHKQMEVARKMKLRITGEKPLDTMELGRRIFSKAKETNTIDALKHLLNVE